MRKPADCHRLQRRPLCVGEEEDRAHRVVAGGTAEGTVVYSLGTLYGAWPDGTPFEGNRYVDRYVVRDGLIVEMDVWNDSAEWLLVRAGLAAVSECRHDAADDGPRWTCRAARPRPLRLPPITRRPALEWPNGARLAVYLGFNLEHFAFGDGLGACLGPVSPQPDVLNYSLARIRQPGRRLALPGAVRPAWACPPRHRQHRAVRPLPRAGAGARGARRRAGRPRPHQRRTPGRLERGGRARAAGRLPRPHRARERPRARPAGCRRGSRKARSRPTCWPRPATATRSTGATTTSRCPCARAAAPALWSVPYPAGAQRHPDDRGAPDGRARFLRRWCVDNFDEMLRSRARSRW
jgi:hypothetical protein